jgi:hypothetical protein
VSLVDDIRSACAGVVAELAESGWQWAARTSDWDAASPTFGTSADLPVLATAYSARREEGSNEAYEIATVSLRVADDGVSSMPKVGDKVVNAAGVDWVVVQLMSGAYGSRRYLAESIERQAMGDPRGRV